jgi:hypothetical protein
VTPTLNRLFRITQSKPIRRFMCLPRQAPSLKLTFEDTIFVNLASSGSLDNDAANTFLALLVNDFYLCAKQRRGRPGKDPSHYFLYVDEFVHAPTPSYARIAAECRKFGLLLVLANQDLSQIKENFGADFAQSILTLCQTQLYFSGINDSDADRLARECGVEKAVLRTLADRKCLVKLPRQSGVIHTFPEVRDPFLPEGRVEEFERRIAAQSGAIRVELIDNFLARNQNQEEPVSQIDGYHVQWRAKPQT